MEGTWLGLKCPFCVFHKFTFLCQFFITTLELFLSQLRISNLKTGCKISSCRLEYLWLVTCSNAELWLAICWQIGLPYHESLTLILQDLVKIWLKYALKLVSGYINNWIWNETEIICYENILRWQIHWTPNCFRHKWNAYFIMMNGKIDCKNFNIFNFRFIF